jgi:thiamine-phosphate pyrophosphorylase
MEKIIVSSSIDLQGEHEMLNELFENGLECFHLRKPEAVKEDLEIYLRKIHPKYISRVVVHSHYSLIEKYNLKGIHLPERVRKEKGVSDILKPAKARRLTLSSSVHSFLEILECEPFDYVFLGPVYPSISKPGYSGNFTPGMYKEWRRKNEIKTKVIALGGVREENMKELMDAGFDGAALLGAIWRKSKTQIPNNKPASI